MPSPRTSRKARRISRLANTSNVFDEGLHQRMGKWPKRVAFEPYVSVG